MLKKIYILLKKVVISAFLLYGYNLIAAPLNLIIPINIVTVTLLTVFGFPALFSLIVVFIIFFK